MLLQCEIDRCQTEGYLVVENLVDAIVDDGCLQLDQGTRDSMLLHGTTTQVGIADTCWLEMKPSQSRSKLRGALLFHPLTPRASLPNNSDGYRWSFNRRHKVTGKPTGRGQFPAFVAQSRASAISVA